MDKETIKNQAIAVTVAAIVAKCGGLEKMEALTRSIRKMPRKNHASFLRGIAKTPEGASQAVALMLAGCSLSVHITKMLPDLN